MRTLVAVTLCLVPFAAVAQEVPPDEYWPLPEPRTFGVPADPADGDAIEALLDDYIRAWAAEDVDGLLDAYTDDVEWTNAYGVVLRGKDALAGFLGEMFAVFDATVAAQEAERRQRLSVRFLGDDTAVVHSVTDSERIESRDGDGARRVHVTYVLQKRDGEWRIAHQMIMDARL